MKRALDLFCKAGGATKGLQRAGFHVIGVDIETQPRYCGDEFIQADALEYLDAYIAGQTLPGRVFDFIWASPPCQRYCALNTMPNRREHPDLVDVVRDHLIKIDALYTIENVFGAPLRNPLMLCGSFFGLRASDGYQLQRHRYFESNFMVLNGHDCMHAEKTIGVYGAKARDIAKEKRHYAKNKETRGEPIGVVLPKRRAFEAMGIDWMNMRELSEAIPPAYSEYIGRFAMQALERAA